MSRLKRVRQGVVALATALVMGASGIQAQQLLYQVNTGIVGQQGGSDLANGFRFTLNNDLTIGGLGGFAFPNFANNHFVGLWTSSGTLLVSTLINNAAPIALADSFSYAFNPSVTIDGVWRMDPFSSPITLTAGDYVLSFGISAGSLDGTVILGSTDFMAGATFGTATNTQVGTNAFPGMNQSFNQGSFGGNLLIAPAYWKGTSGSSWEGSNWVADFTGTALSTGPKNVNVIFSALGASNQGATTIAGDISINSLTVIDTIPVSIGNAAGGPYRLSIGNQDGIAIRVNNASNLTIGANVLIATAGNTVEVNDTGAATISGVLSGTNGLTKTGTGTLTLSGVNTLTGVVNLNLGNIELGNSLALQNAVLNPNGGGLTASGGVTDPVVGGLTGFGNLTLPGAMTSLTLNVATGTMETYAGVLGGTALRLVKGGEGTQFLTGANVYAGGTTVRSGLLVVDGGSINHTDGDTIVGLSNGDEAFLEIRADSSVTNQFGTVGSDSGSVGTVTVKGTDATWMNSGDYLWVGLAGTGTLNIEDGGQVSSLNALIGTHTGSNGTVNVTGAGSVWNNSTDMDVGSSDTGELNISAGGVVTSTTVYVAYGPNSTGTVTVIGADSKFALSSNSYFGFSGEATVTIADGGEVSTTIADLAYDAGTSTLNLNGTAGSRGILKTGYVAESAGVGVGDAFVNFDGGILQATSDQPDFLRFFEAGDVQILAGGAFIDSNGFEIGIGTAMEGSGALTKLGEGTLTLTGANTYSGTAGQWNGTIVEAGTLTVTGATAGISHSIRDFIVGSAAANVLDGADVSARALAVDGALATPGKLVVDGVGSTFSAGYTVLGNLGSGELTVQAGGAVTVGALLISNQPNSTGKLTVTGADSTLSASLTQVGYASSGEVNVLEGGVLTSTGTVLLGTGGGGSATATVSGAGSKWDATNSEFDIGNATLKVLDGGEVIANHIVLTSAAPTIEVDGADSLLSVSATKAFSSAGAAFITVSNGGELNAGNQSILSGGTNAYLTVKDAGSEYHVAGILSVSNQGFKIQDGGVVNSGLSTLNSNSSNVMVEVSGMDAAWNHLGSLGLQGTSSLTISDGGAVISDVLYLYGSGGVSISGVGSSLTSGYGTTGSLFSVQFGDLQTQYGITVSDGGLLQATRSFLGFSGTATDISITGTDSAWISLSEAQVLKGSVTVSDGGLVQVNSGGVDGAGTLYLNDQLGSIGVLNIGADPLLAAASAGTVDATVSSRFIGTGQAVVNFNHTSSAYTFDNALNNNLQVNHYAGVTELTADNSYSGGTIVYGGKLIVNNSTGSGTGSGAVQVNNGAELGGNGFIAGVVTIANGGSLAPGNSPDVISFGGLVLNSGSILNFELGDPLGTPGVDSDLIDVTNDLTLNGNINIAALTGFDVGSFAIITYGGLLTDDGLGIGLRPAGYAFAVDTTTSPGTVFLNASFDGLQFWDGADFIGNGTVDGGSGTWNTSDTNWTNNDGIGNTNWQDMTAVFAGAAGLVEIAEDVYVTGLEFTTGGYNLQSLGGYDIIMDNLDTEIVVDAAVLPTTITADITGTGSIVKNGLGTLVLKGNNDYTDGTIVKFGTLTLDGGSIYHPTYGDFIVGDLAGDSGTFNAQNGALVDSLSAVLGSEAGAVGTATVSGLGTVWNIDTFLLVGDLGSGSSFTIEDQAVVNTLTAMVGVGDPLDDTVGNNNILTVTGAGSYLESYTGITVGMFGSNNQMIISEGANAVALGAIVGYAQGENNSMTVTGAGSKLDLEAALVVGALGSNNWMLVDGGATVEIVAPTPPASISDLTVGLGDGIDPASGSGNSLIVSGAGSAVTGANLSLTVGGFGSNNTLTVSNGGKVEALFGGIGGGDYITTDFGNDNYVLVTGANSLLSIEEDFTVGYFGNDNTLAVQSQGTAKSGYAIIGFGDDFAINPDVGANNLAQITGAGSSWQITHDLYVGFYGSDNTLQVLNGATVTAETAVVGYGDIATTGFGDNNQLVVSGVGSTLVITGSLGPTCGCGSPVSSLIGDSDLVIGLYGTNNSLTVADGGKVIVNAGLGQITLGQETNSGGTLNIGAASGYAAVAPGIVEAAQVTGGDGQAVVQFNHTATSSIPYYFTKNGTALTGAVLITGSAAVQQNAGYTVLTGANTYTGGTTINGGSLVANNTTGSATGTGDVFVNGGTLGGSGNISGAVIFNAPATISPGNSPGTLTVGSLALRSDTALNFELATPNIVGSNVNDLVRVTGNLTLAGMLNVIDAGGFGAGTYRLFEYGGSLTNNGLNIASVPTGVNPGNLLLDLNTGGQISLIYSPTNGNSGVNGTVINTITGEVVATNFVANQQYWDGSSYNANGVIDGGNGVWKLADTNWTNVQGMINGAWAGQTAVFTATPGTVTLGENIPFQKLIFEVGGYRIEGGNFQLYSTGDAEIQTLSGTTTLNATTIINGSFTKSGGGKLDLRSPMLAAGGTIIAQGTLAVNSVLTSPSVLVSHGATLMGSGLIIGNVTSSGIVAPGNSIGTLSIDGNYTQRSNGTLQIEIGSPANHDLLVVSGTAKLSGTLEIVSLGYDAAYGDQIPFLLAGKITGKFNSIEMPQADLYRGRFLNEGGVGVLLVAPTSYTLVANTPNELSLAHALDEWIGVETGDIGDVTLALDLLREDQYAQAFNAVMPGYYESAMTTANELSHSHSQVLHQQLNARRIALRFTQPTPQLSAEASGKNPKDVKATSPVQAPAEDYRWNAWTIGSGLFSEGGLSLQPGEDFDSGTFLAGADYAFNEHFALGLFASYQEGWGDYDFAGDIDLESTRFGGYATFDFGGFYANAVIGGGQTGFDVKRPIQWAYLDRDATSEPDGYEFFTSLGAGYDIKAGNWTFGPQLTVQYSDLQIGEFTETGAGSLNLRVKEAEMESLRSYLGGRVAYTIQVNETFAIIPEFRAFWQHEYLEGGDISAQLDSGFGGNFGYQSNEPDKDAVYVGAGLGFQIGPRIYANIYYNADFGRNDDANHTVSVSATIRF